MRFPQPGSSPNVRSATRAESEGAAAGLFLPLLPSVLSPEGGQRELFLERIAAVYFSRGGRGEAMLWRAALCRSMLWGCSVPAAGLESRERGEQPGKEAEKEVENGRNGARLGFRLCQP